MGSSDALGKGAEQGGDIGEREKCPVHEINAFHLHSSASQNSSSVLTLIILSNYKSVLKPVPFWSFLVAMVLSGTEDLIASALKRKLPAGKTKIHVPTFPSCVSSPGI